MFVKHKFFAFPIVDELNQMRGVIDIGFFSEETISVVERQKIEDIYELIGFGMAQLKGRSAFGVLRYRLPWLLTMVASGVICAVLASVYEATLTSNVFIVFFLILPTRSYHSHATFPSTAPGLTASFACVCPYCIHLPPAALAHHSRVHDYRDCYWPACAWTD
jgi:hypothetical protein